MSNKKRKNSNFKKNKRNTKRTTVADKLKIVLIFLLGFIQIKGLISIGQLIDFIIKICNFDKTNKNK